MKHVPHTGREHIQDKPRTNFFGNRRRLIPETETEEALIVSILDRAATRKRGEYVMQVARVSGDPATDLLPDSPDEIDPGWYGYEYTVAPIDPWMTGGFHHTVYGYSCVTEHPHCSGKRRLGVWHHIPAQNGYDGVSSGLTDFPVVLTSEKEAIKLKAIEAEADSR